MKIQRLPVVPEDEWRRLAATCPAATFFHTTEWARAVVHTEPGLSEATAAFRHEDGRLFILPLTAVAHLGGLLKTLHSQALGRPGGFLYDVPPADEEVQSMLNTLLDWRTPGLTLIESHDSPLQLPGIRHPFETQVLALPKSFEDLLAGFEAETRRTADRAERRGVSVRLARSESDWASFMNLQEKSMARQSGETHLRPAFIQALSALSIGQCRLWLAEFEGAIIAAALVFYHRSRAVWYLAGFDYEHRDKNPNNLLIREILRDAIDREMIEFDFGGSPGLPGVEKFKSGFGARTVIYHRIHYVNPLYAPLLKLRRRK